MTDPFMPEGFTTNYDRARRDMIESHTIAELNEQYHLDQRVGMEEFRVTFGWNQRHGPSPENYRGHYTTVWAPTMSQASAMAMERYDGVYSRIYRPEQWADWGPEMDGCKELEVLQYWNLSDIVEWPQRNMMAGDVHIGRGRE